VYGGKRTYCKNWQFEAFGVQKLHLFIIFTALKKKLQL
jgi:hypothetical protein